jgi:phospholipid/cholesterol/gamma-HCH transport system substrate-binding protein
LASVRGTDPGQDLTRLVEGFEGFATVFNRKQDQFGNILDSLDRTTGAFNAARQPVAQAFATLPQTLISTRNGLSDLQVSLDRLTDTAPKFRDSVQELDPMLKGLAPVVSKARPAVADLKEALQDAQPTIEHLSPVARQGNEMFDDIKGPVLDRVNGPIKDAVLNPWHGSGVYANGGNDHKLYQEIGYLTYSLADDFGWHDASGGFGRLAAGENGSVLTGGSQFPRSFEEQLESLGVRRPLGPQDSDPKRDKGFGSDLGNTPQPVNKGLPNPPPIGPAPLLPGGSNPLTGGSK